MSGARERRSKIIQRDNGESHQRQRRNQSMAADQKDSNDLWAYELQLTGFDCSDYNIGRNQFPEDGEEQQQQQEPDYADSNEDLLDHGDNSNDLGVFDLATLCLLDSDADNGPDLHLCKDISKAKGQIIPYEYRVYLSKNIDNSNKELDDGFVAIASKAGTGNGSSTADTASSSRMDTVRVVERRVMAHVASKMGLADCDSSNSSSPPPNPALRRRSLSSTSSSIEPTGLQNLAEGSQSPLIGISSDPVDGIAGEIQWSEQWISKSAYLPFSLRMLTRSSLLCLWYMYMYLLSQQTALKILQTCHFIAFTSGDILRHISTPLRMIPP